MPGKLRVIVGVSGGVDSAVSALLLQRAGHDVSALFMKNWEEDDDAEYCAAADDLREASAVCARLGIPLHTVNFAHEYWERVFTHFLNEYRQGRTPNPDVMCNQEIKFKAFLDHALSLGADKIATGHYARTRERDGKMQLVTAADTNKDQTYFLHRLNQHQLRHTLFPLADIAKPTVRALANTAGFANHARKDSTGICFIGERKFKDFLARYLPAQPGEIHTLAGARVGTHDGAMYYTIGQRQGLGIGGGGANTPWYVADKDVARNIVYVVQGEDDPALYRQTLTAEQLHWIAGSAPTLPFACVAKARYRQAAQACTIEQISDDIAHVRFADAQRALTPGQSIVFYRDDECLGGGVIQAHAAAAAPAAIARAALP